MKSAFYTLEDVARILDVVYMTAYRWARSGKLKAYKVGKQYRVQSEDLKKFIEGNQVRDLGPANRSLTTFIGSGLMDYAYMESRHFPIDLGLGVNPLGCSPLVSRAVGKLNIDLAAYSQVSSEALRAKLAKTYRLKSNQLLLDAGVSGLLHLCFLTFLNPGDRVVMPLTTFPALEMIALLTHGSTVFVPLAHNYDVDYDRLAKSCTRQTKLVVLCNPNNPTGKQLDLRKLGAIIRRSPKTVFVIDEANIEFGGNSALDMVKKLKNLIVLRSFSKGFGLAGLRIGFAVGHTDLLYALQRRQTPFSVNSVAQHLAAVALDDLTFIKKSRQFIQGERKYLEKGLKKLGFSFVPSDSNYLLVDISSSLLSSQQFVAALNERGANAIDGDDFQGLSGMYIRLSPRTRDVNEKFLAVLEEMAQ